MGQTEAVSQFMERRFFEAIQEKRFISRGIIKPGMKPVIGNDRACSAHLGQPEDILQYGYIQVYIGNRYDFVRTFFAVKMFKYSLGIVLLSSFTIGKCRRLEAGLYIAWETGSCKEEERDLLGKGMLHFAKRAYPDATGEGNGGQLLLRLYRSILL